MKNFVKSLGKAIVVVLTLILIVVSGWAFLSLAAIMLLLASPILVTIFTYWANVAKKVAEKGESVIESFEDFLDSVTDELKE